MGIKITKETLEKIYKDYNGNKSNIPKSKIIKDNTNNLNYIIKTNLIINNVDINENKKILKANNYNENEQKAINENRKKLNNELNYILFRKHKSFELEKNKKLQEDLVVKEKNDLYYEIASMNDNESVNSDYMNISNESIIINKIKNRETNKVKSIYLRNSYYTKLLLSNILTFKKENKINNLFFFDWDDTLMCTSYLAPKGVLDEEDLKNIDKNVIKNLDQLSCSLLSKSLEKGNVFIITNAAHGWIEYSSKKLYPLTSKILKLIKIVSARGLYEKRLPGDYRQWKSRAFIDTILNSGIDLRKSANILCFGDSIIELEASHKLKEIFADAYIKTIKFKEAPQPLELIKELKIILNQFDVILSNVRSLSIKVAKKKNE